MTSTNEILVHNKEKQVLLTRLDELSEVVGNTPLYRIRRVFSKPNVEVYAKLEWMQLGNSVKARAAYNIIRTAIEEDKLDFFRKAFADNVEKQASEAQRAPRIYVDAEVDFEELSLSFLDSYELLQPFGSQNPQPVFMARDVWLTESPNRLKNNHIKLFMRQNYCEKDAIFFGGGERTLPPPPWDIAFTVDRNVYRGTTSLQMVIQEVRSAKNGQS